MTGNADMAGRQFTGYHMIGVLVLFFGTIIAVNLTLAYYANSTWSGLVVKNSYVASQKFNGEQAIARKHAELGWQASVAYAGDAFTFTLKDASGNPVAAESVKVKLMRPANEGQDHVLIMQAVGGGQFVAPAKLEPGQWVAEVLAEAGLDTPYRYARRIVVKPEAPAK